MQTTLSKPKSFLPWAIAHNLYRFVDWVMILPKALEAEFWQQFIQFEQERSSLQRSTAMKVIVRDAEIFKNIELHQLRDYLESHSWHLDRPFLDNATIWLKQEPQRGEFEILLPNSQDLGDYVSRICETIEILATVENRSQLEIIGELITNNFQHHYSRISNTNYVSQWWHDQR